MSGRLFWEVVWDRFDPGRPPESGQHRASRTSGPGIAILRDLTRPFGSPHRLLCGPPGCGKSTELVRIAEGRADDDLVIHLDLAAFLDHVVQDPGALQRLVSWEIAFLLGLALVHVGETLPGFAWDPKLLLGLGRAWKGLSDRPGDTEPEIVPLARRVPVLVSARVRGAGLDQLGGPSQSGAWPLALGGRSEVPTQDPRVRNLAALLRRMVDTLRVQRPVLLVLDGLDHLSDEARLRGLLFDSGLIADLPCGQLVAAPMGLRRGDETRASSRYSVHTLYNESILDPAAPAHHGPGIEIFSEIFRQRTADLAEAPEEILEEPLIRRLAYHCGGRLRDFSAALRLIAERAWDEDLGMIPPTLVAEVLDRQRRQLEAGLDASHISLLRNVVLDPLHALPHDAEAEALLRDGRLLVYSGDTEWYFPHTLLLVQRIKLRQTTSAPNLP